MDSPGAIALAAAGAASAVAAVAHLACIAIGPGAYRFMGAGERMARAVEQGKLRPTLVTLGIAVVLLAWAAYAFSAAGFIGRLPFVQIVLPVVCAAYLLRAVCFPLLRPAFPENSGRFWLVSSAICLLIGGLHLYGILLQWPL